MEKTFTDKQLLDYLQMLNDRENYTGVCILRESTLGRGWRLHETGKINSMSSTDVRIAIAKHMMANGIEPQGDGS